MASIATKNGIGLATRKLLSGTTSARCFSAAVDSEASLLSDAAKRCIALEEKHGAHNYHPLPVVLTSGKGMLNL